MRRLSAFAEVVQVEVRDVLAVLWQAVGARNKPEPHDPVRIEWDAQRDRLRLRSLFVALWRRGLLVVLQPPNQLSVLDDAPWELAAPRRQVNVAGVGLAQFEHELSKSCQALGLPRGRKQPGL